MPTSTSSSISKYLHKLNGLIGGIRTDVYLIRETSEFVRQEPPLVPILDRIDESAVKIRDLTNNFLDTVIILDDQSTMPLKDFLEQINNTSNLSNFVEIKISNQESIKGVQVPRKITELLLKIIIYAHEMITANEGGIVIQVDLSNDSSHVEIVIIDAGRSIQDTIVQTLFKANALARSSEKDLWTSLLWAKLLLQNLGGNLEIRLEEDSQGTTFLISIPINSQNNGS
jgi:K+-sensing histidine kinase KdpD